MEDADAIETALLLLRDNGVILDRGLDESEFRRLREQLDVEFSPDHRDLLRRALPQGPGFPDWRNASVDDLRRRLDWPKDGVRWDVENNGFWPPTWGRRPTTRQARSRLVARQLAAVPQLLPVFGHRFLPGGDAPRGVPILSVMQTDVIVYGWNLLDYFRHELELPRDEPPQRSLVIPFWGQIARAEPGFVRTGNGFRNVSIEGSAMLPPDAVYEANGR
ncbi:hypothetical protein ACX9R5_03255 [Rathayibacter sp. CAU 1779]